MAAERAQISPALTVVTLYARYILPVQQRGAG
jgi:hypothetical protein